MYLFLLLIQHIKVAFRSINSGMTTVLHARKDGIDLIMHNIRGKKFNWANQGTNIFRKSLSNRGILRFLIYFRNEKKLVLLKRIFLKDRVIHFFMSSINIFGTMKLNKLTFVLMEINKPLISILSIAKARFKFRSQPKLLLQIRTPITLRIESCSVISMWSNIAHQEDH